MYTQLQLRGSTRPPVSVATLDITPGRKPRFVRNFKAGHDNPLAAIGGYVEAVKQRSYPAPEHCF
jgi:3-methyl-2-oxobutanoate hydroxymethyltransferase